MADLDYVGFEHYRRMFLFPSLFEGVDDLSIPPVPEGWWHGYADDGLFDRMLQVRTASPPHRIDALKSFLSSVDIVLPLPSTSETLKEQWIWCKLGLETLETLVRCIESTVAYRAAPFEINVDANKTYFCNMFVMRTALFSGYMELWEQVMFAMQAEVDFSNRMPGYLSERLFSIYFRQKIIDDKLKVAEVPFYLCQERKV